MITNIDPQAVRTQTASKKTSPLSGVGFSDFMGAAGNTAATGLAVTQGYQPAAVTSAAISGIAGAPGALGAAGAPYGTLQTSTPLNGIGYNYGGSGSGGPQFNAGYGFGPGGSSGGGFGVSGGGAYGGWSTQDNYEKNLLFQNMNDANWEMLMAQVTVNEISRDYQARSNILKTKSDTELNAVRNMRA